MGKIWNFAASAERAKRNRRRVTALGLWRGPGVLWSTQESDMRQHDLLDQGILS